MDAAAGADGGKCTYPSPLSKGGGGSGLQTLAIADPGAKKLHLQDVPWMLFLKTPAFWALVIAHAMFGVTYNISMSWMPSYYNSAFGVDVKQSALLSVLPFAVMGIMTNAGGWIADGLMNSGVLTTTRTRKLLQALGTGTPAVCLWYLSGAKHGSVTAAMVVLTLMLGGLGLQSGGFASTHQDISTRYAGLIFGLTNACSSLAGSVSVYITGAVLDHTHNWGLVFGMVSFCNVCSLIAFVLLATSEPLFE
jgi:ACS family sodium-dependent inorganic phosphate cotransporter